MSNNRAEEKFFSLDELRRVPLHEAPSCALAAESRPCKREALGDAMGNGVLTGDEKEYLNLRYGLNGKGPYSLTQCAAILGVEGSREEVTAKVEQIEAKAIGKLRAHFDNLYP